MERQDWFSKPISKKAVVYFLIAFATISLFFALKYSIYDTDIYFMIATGNEIIDNGIPYTNVWAIDRVDGFVAQQWLYDIAIALAYRFGTAGLTVFYVLQFVILIFLLDHFFNIRKVPKVFKLFCVGIVIFLSSNYTLLIRPQLITMLLLLTECIALEHYSISRKWQWLLLLPVAMLLEINLHASMWPIHYAILLAYMAPAFYIHNTIDKSLYHQWKPIAIMTCAMTAVMFINPYGIDGITYIVKSFLADTFSYVDIPEMRDTTFLSVCGLSILIEVLLYYLAYKHKVLTSVSSNMTAGFVLLEAMVLRNNIFAIFIFAFLIRDLAEYYQNYNFDKLLCKIKNIIIPYCLIFLVIYPVCYEAVGQNSNFVTYDKCFDKVCDYVSQSGKYSAHILTDTVIGSYFEYRGFNNVYMDSRPEIYTYSFTGGPDILSDFSVYCLNGYDPTETECDYSSFVTKEKMDNWFYSYDFEYVVIRPLVSPFLSAYMACNADYQLVEECDNELVLLYERR